MFAAQTQLPAASLPHPETKVPNLCQLSMGFLTWVTCKPKSWAQHPVLCFLLLVMSAPALLLLLQKTSYTAPYLLLSLMGNPFKSSVRKCFGRRLPNSQEGHTAYLSEISCAMASFSFTNCKSSLKWRHTHTQKKAMKQVAQWRTSSLS